MNNGQPIKFGCPFALVGALRLRCCLRWLLTETWRNANNNNDL